MEDNTEKREVNVANGLNVVDDVDVHAKLDAQSFIHLPNLQPVRAIFGFSAKNELFVCSGDSELATRPTVPGSSTASRRPRKDPGTKWSSL